MATTPAEREALVEKIWSQKNEYIAGCDDGVRQWECLIDLIYSGHVSEEELPDYGIEV